MWPSAVNSQTANHNARVNRQLHSQNQLQLWNTYFCTYSGMTKYITGRTGLTVDFVHITGRPDRVSVRPESHLGLH